MRVLIVILTLSVVAIALEHPNSAPAKQARGSSLNPDNVNPRTQYWRPRDNSLMRWETRMSRC